MAVHFRLLKLRGVLHGYPSLWRVRAGSGDQHWYDTHAGQHALRLYKAKSCPYNRVPASSAAASPDCGLQATSYCSVFRAKDIRPQPPKPLKSVVEAPPCLCVASPNLIRRTGGD